MTGRALHRLLAGNALVNLLRYMVNFGVAMFLTPIIIRGIGDSSYGFLALLYSLIGYAGLLDIGIQHATIKLVAEYNGRDDRRKLHEIAVTATIFFISLGSIAFVICSGILPFVLPKVVDIPDGVESLALMLFLLGLDILACFASNVLTGVCLGFNRYYVKGIVDICLGSSRAVGTILILNAGGGLLELIELKLGLEILCAVLMLAGARYYAGPIQTLKPTRHALKELLSYGGKVFSASVMVRINRSSNPLLISAMLSTVWTAYFTIAMRLVDCLQEVVISITASFMPVFSEMKAREEETEMASLYIKGSRFLLLITLPMYMGIYILGPDFIGIWLDDTYAAQAGPTLRLLAVWAALCGMLPLIERRLIGGGAASEFARVVGTTNTAGIILSASFIPLLGIEGVALAMCICKLAEQGYFIARSGRLINIPATEIITGIFGRLLMPAGIFAASLYTLKIWIPTDNLAGMTVVTATSLLVYFLAVWTASLTATERSAVLSVMGRSATATAGGK